MENNNNSDNLKKFDIERGMRIAQIFFHKLPEIEIIESETLSKTDRDKGGFGSTGLDWIEVICSKYKKELITQLRLF